MNVQVVIPTLGNPDVLCIEAAEYICRGGLPVKYIQSTRGAGEAKSHAVYWFMNCSKADYLLILDDDIVANPDLLSMVDRGVDVVGAPYMTFIPSLSLIPHDCVYRNRNGLLIPMEDSCGIVECDVIGSGALCVRRGVLEKVKPAFLNEYDNWGRLTVSDDVHFCNEAKKIGYKIWADYDVRCEHLKCTALTDMVRRVEMNTLMWNAGNKVG